MGIGNFKQPKAGPQTGGPKVGETVDYSKLPPERKAELGDLESLKATPTPEPELSKEDEERAQQGAEQLEALQAVIAKEEQEDVDVAEARLQEMAEPTIEDRRQFLRCLLGNGTYEKRYEMYGGMLVMTMHDISPKLEDRIFVEMAHLVETGDIKTDDDWNLWLDRIRLMLYVSDVRMAKNEAIKWGCFEHLGEDKQLAMQAWDRLRMFPSTALARAALQTVRVFMRHMEIMLDRALDSDFWEVGGLDLPYEPMSAEQSDTENSLP
jgi:hypothetical protein